MYKLCFSYFNSAICSWVVAFLMPLLILEITNSPIYVSATYAVSMLPYVIITPFAGVLGDSLNKKHILQVGELISGIFTFLLTIVPFNISYVWLLLTFHFVLSSVLAAHHPVFQAIIPSVVSKQDVSNFNAYVGTIDQLIGISAPALIGLFLMVGTKKQLFYFISVGYLFSSFLISLINYKHNKASIGLSVRSILNSMADGLRYVWSKDVIKYAMLLFVGANFGTQFFYASFMYHLKNNYLIPENQVSYYFIPLAIGSIFGSLLAPRLMNRFDCGRIIAVATGLDGCITLLVSLTYTPFMTVILLAISSALSAIVVVSYFTLRQRVVPTHLLSRTVAVTRAISYLAIPLGAISGGLLFKQTNNFTCVVIIGGAVIFLSAILFWKPLTYSGNIENRET